MSLAFRLTITLLLELLYALLTRAWMPFYFRGIGLELLISACRAVMAGVAWLLFRDLVRSRLSSLKPHQRPAVVAVAMILFMEALLCGNAGLSGWPLQSTWAATSLIVGIHEELVFRGVLQNVLSDRLGGFAAIALSNVCFTLFHYGAQPLDPYNAFSIFTTGCVLGVIYGRSGSLATVVVIHSILDATFSFSPFLRVPWPPLFFDFFDLVALLLALSLYPSRRATGESKMPQFVRIADDV